jgi:hypothetical protein
MSYDFIKIAKIQPHFIKLHVTSVYLKNSDSEAFENIIRSRDGSFSRFFLDIDTKIYLQRTESQSIAIRAQFQF